MQRSTAIMSVMSGLAVSAALFVLGAPQAHAQAAPVVAPGDSAVAREFRNVGGPAGPLGPATGTLRSASLIVERHRNGEIVWSAGTDAHAVQGAIAARYDAAGGAWGALGLPLTDELVRPDGTGRFTDFSAGASIFWTPYTSAHIVMGAIRAQWAAMGAEAGPLGYPVTDELGTPDGIGRFNHFSNGASIYWTPATGAHAVYGAVREKWAATGWELGPLGYPVTDELGTPNGGRYNHFSKGGSVYWTAVTGAHAVYGAIHAAWAASGWEVGPLGYPVTDELGTADGKGRYNHFSKGGSVYWTPATGAQPVYGEIWAAWARSGYEAGPLGYPTAAETATATGTGRVSTFSGGVLPWSWLTGAHPLVGAFASLWQRTGQDGGSLGYPIGDDVAYGNGRRQDFEHGAGVLSAGADTVQALYPPPFAWPNIRSGDASITIDVSALAYGSYEVSTDGVTWSPLAVRPLPDRPGWCRGRVDGLVNGRTSLVEVRTTAADVASAPWITSLRVGPSASPPTVTSVDAHDGWAQVRFTAPPVQSESSTVTYEASSDDGATWTALNVRTVDGTLTAPLTGLPDGTPSHVRVRAVVDGALGGGAAVAVTPHAAALPPLPVVAGAASARAGVLTVDLTSPADTDPDVGAYEWSADDGTTWAPVTGAWVSRATGTTRVEVPAVTLPDALTLSLRARNSAGTSPTVHQVLDLSLPVIVALRAERSVSSGVTVTVTLAPTSSVVVATFDWSNSPASPPAWWASRDRSTTFAVPAGVQYPYPDTLSLRVTDGSRVSGATRTDVVGVGPAPPVDMTSLPYDRALLIDFGTAVGAIGYQWSLDGTTWTRASEIGGFVPGRAGIMIDHLDNGTLYRVWLRSFSTFGYSAPVSVEGTPAGGPLTSVPAPVSGLTAVGGDGTVTLSWDAPAQAETRYDLTKDDEGSWNTPVVSAGPGRLATTVPGLTNGRPYRFRVRAAYGVLDGPYSQEITATPLRP